jgi:hypothetical protein
MKNLAHSASFESLDKDAPSNAGTKQLGLAPLDPIDFIGKPVLLILLKRALDKARLDAVGP